MGQGPTELWTAGLGRQGGPAHRDDVLPPEAGALHPGSPCTLGVLGMHRGPGGRARELELKQTRSPGRKPPLVTPSARSPRQ